MKRTIPVLLILCLSMLAFVLSGHSEDAKNCFETSLHYTTHGMERWYDAKDGFSAITGVPYKDLGCKNCHATSCDDCHLEETESGYVYSVAKAQRSETCLKCHAREKATLDIDTERNTLGVHMAAGMTCSDCHTAREVHGDGTLYESMRAPGAMDADCENCHTPGATEYPAVPATESHLVHGDEVDCEACHVQNSMTCYNCHFGVLKKTGSKPESMVGKMKDFLLLVKYDGKVTSGTMQTLVGPDNYPFITYVPYFTHSVSAQGRKCEDCHDTKAVNIMAAGETFTPLLYDDGAFKSYEGVIPVVPNLLQWPFLEKVDGKWREFMPQSQPLVQMGVYAEPLSQAELESMLEPYVSY